MPYSCYKYVTLALLTILDRKCWRNTRTFKFFLLIFHFLLLTTCICNANTNTNKTNTNANTNTSASTSTQFTIQELPNRDRAFHAKSGKLLYINILIFRLSNIDLLGNWFAVSLATHTQTETHSQLDTWPRAPCAACDRLRSDRIVSDRNGSVWLSSAWIGWVNLGGVQAPRYYCRRQTNWPDAEFGAFITNRQRLRGCGGCTKLAALRQSCCCCCVCSKASSQRAEMQAQAQAPTASV